MMKLSYFVIFIATFFLPFQQCSAGKKVKPIEDKQCVVEAKSKSSKHVEPPRNCKEVHSEIVVDKPGTIKRRVKHIDKEMVKIKAELLGDEGKAKEGSILKKIHTIEKNLDTGTDKSVGFIVQNLFGKDSKSDIFTTISLVKDLRSLDGKVEINKGKLNTLLTNVDNLIAAVKDVDDKVDSNGGKINSNGMKLDSLSTDLLHTKNDIEAKIDLNAEKIQRIEQILADNKNLQKENTRLQKENTRLLRKLSKMLEVTPPAKCLRDRQKGFHW